MKNYYFEPEIINKLSAEASWAKDLDDARPFQLICNAIETLHSIYGMKDWVSSTYRPTHMVRERLTQSEYDKVQRVCRDLLKELNAIHWEACRSVDHDYKRYPDIVWDLRQLQSDLETIFTFCFMFHA